MRILFVNTSERAGGAAIAAERLRHALSRRGDEVTLLCRDRVSDALDVQVLPHLMRSRLCNAAERMEIVCRNGFSRQGMWAIDHGRWGVDITRLPQFEQADVVHLHWVNQGLLSLDDIAAIARSGKRVVWTLHDGWAFTGICHAEQYHCDRWLMGCGHCPLIRHGQCADDLSAATFRRKRAAYDAGAIQFVTCSQWLADMARQSPLMQGRPITAIPNCIDTDTYTLATPEVREALRRQHGLPTDCRLILFVAYKATDPKKGFDTLRRAMALLDGSRYALLIVGKGATTLAEGLPCRAVPMEYISDAAFMRDLYRSADLLAMPTLIDNLPNTIVEAMACGLPAVGSRVGGLPEMIHPGRDGDLCPVGDAEAMAEAIRRITEGDEATLAAYREAARATAVAQYGEAAVVARYRAVYQA